MRTKYASGVEESLGIATSELILLLLKMGDDDGNDIGDFIGVDGCAGSFDATALSLAEVVDDGEVFNVIPE